MTEWIYVEDGVLPKTDQEIFVWDVCGKPNLCRAVFDGTNFKMNTGGRLQSVIAWMPEPEEPKRIYRREILQDRYDVKYK